MNKNLFFIIVFIFSFPLVLHLLISIPLSVLIQDIKPIYTNWSASGTWIVTTLFSTYIFSFNLYKNFFKVESLLSLPISSVQLITFSYIFSLIIAFIQLIISMIILGALNNDHINILNFIKLFILLFPVAIIVINISYFISISFKSTITLTIIHLLFFVILTFNYGAFIPLKYFPTSYTKFIELFPIPGLISNAQKIVSSESTAFSFFLISMFSCIVLSSLTFFKIDKRITNK